MAKLINRHTAPIDGVLPGQVGEFDVLNPAIKGLMQSRRLVPEGEPLDAPKGGTANALDRENAALRERIASMQQQYDLSYGNLQRERDDLVQERDGLKARVHGLEAEVAELRSKKKPRGEPPTE